MKTAEFGQPATHLPQPGKCRICGCTQERACQVAVQPTHGGPVAGAPWGYRPCGWADQTKTLCDGPDCITAAKREIGR